MKDTIKNIALTLVLFFALVLLGMFGYDSEAQTEIDNSDQSPLRSTVIVTEYDKEIRNVWLSVYCAARPHVFWDINDKGEREGTVSIDEVADEAVEKYKKRFPQKR